MLTTVLARRTINLPPPPEVSVMRILPIAVLVGSALLAACATTRMSEPERLALYMNHASEPLQKITYRTPTGWDHIDNSHLLVTIKPTQGWLFKLAPDCMTWTGSGPILSISNMAGTVTAGFDNVTSVGPGIPESCRILEIREVDLAGVRSERNAKVTTP